MNTAYIYILLMLSVASLYSAEKDMQPLSNIKTCPLIIVHEGIEAVHTDIYTKLLGISRTLQDQVNDFGKLPPLPNEPYYPVKRNIESLQHIVNFISAQNTDTYLSTLSLIELVYLYQEANFWSVDTHILDTILNCMITQLRNADTLSRLFSSKENLSHFINTCNTVTHDTLTRTLHTYTYNLLAQPLTCHNGVNSLKVHTDGTLFLCSWDRTISVWKTDAQGHYYCAQTLRGHIDSVCSMAVHTDGTLFSASNDCTIRVWKKDEQGIYYCMQILTGQTDCINSIAVHIDGTLFSCSDNATIRVWKQDAHRKYKRMQTLTGHTNSVCSVAVHTDGTLFSGSRDHTIIVWKKDTQGIYYCIQILAGQTSFIDSVAVHTNSTLFSCEANRIIRIGKTLEEYVSLKQYLFLQWLYNTYQLNQNTQLRTLPAHQFQIYHTLPQSIKDHLVTWYKPGRIQYLFFKPYVWISAGIMAGCATLGTYVYYKWFKK
ncbi:WD40 repeat domain-containing protein [Vermiphilus pyriformis]|nr:MAG: WD40 repeat domain-containing protein [Vermiphilus pyriformis]